MMSILDNTKPMRVSGTLFVSLVVFGLAPTGCEFFLGTQVLDVEIPASFSVPLPITMPEQSVIEGSSLDDENQREVDLPSIYAPIDLVSLVPELDEYRGHIKSVRINSITHEVTSNSLDVSLQPLHIRVGTSDGSYDEASELAATSSLPAHTTGSLTAGIDESGRSAAANRMASLVFGVGVKTSFLVPEDYQTSGGSIDSDLWFDLTVVANPID